LLQNQEMVKPALVYSLYSFWTACIFAYVANRMEARKAGEADDATL